MKRSSLPLCIESARGKHLQTESSASFFMMPHSAQPCQDPAGLAVSLGIILEMLKHTWPLQSALNKQAPHTSPAPPGDSRESPVPGNYDGVNSVQGDAELFFFFFKPRQKVKHQLSSLFSPKKGLYQISTPSAVMVTISILMGQMQSREDSHIASALCSM